MVGNELKITEIRHPNKDAKKLYDSLIAIDEHKENLLRNLCLLLGNENFNDWYSKHHNKNLGILNYLQGSTPLIILSGDVGCGKTALAQSIGTPLAEKLDNKILCMETPSNIRGSGMVGEISNRITEAFKVAKAKVNDKIAGILIIDEADDIVTSRAQNQAHHEDRAGLNVFIKQIDLLKREKRNLAVIIITNRFDVLDPAVLRRASLSLTFSRPEGDKLELVFKSLLEGVNYNADKMNELVGLASSHNTPYSFSDLIQRIGQQALLEAMEKDIPFSIELYKKILISTKPSPPIQIGKLN